MQTYQDYDVLETIIQKNAGVQRRKEFSENTDTWGPTEMKLLIQCMVHDERLRQKLAGEAISNMNIDVSVEGLHFGAKF